MFLEFPSLFSLGRLHTIVLARDYFEFLVEPVLVFEDRGKGFVFGSVTLSSLK